MVYQTTQDAGHAERRQGNIERKLCRVRPRPAARGQRASEVNVQRTGWRGLGVHDRRLTLCMSAQFRAIGCIAGKVRQYHMIVG